MNAIHSLQSIIRRDSNLKGLLHHSGVLYAGGIISMLLTVVQQVTTARFLGPTDYGLLATVIGTSALVMLVLDVRTWELGNKLLARPLLDKAHHEAARIITWLALADLSLGLLGASLLLLLARPVATHLLKAPELDALVRLYAVSIPFHILSLGIVSAVLRVFDRFSWLAAKSVGYALLRLILISGPAFLKLGLTAVLLGAMLGEVLNALTLLAMTWVILRREMPGVLLIDLAKPRSFTAGRELMGQLWVSATLKGLQLETFIPVLALLTSPAQVGLFRLGLDIAETIARLVTPVSIVIAPSLIKIYEQETPARFLRYIKQSVLVLAALAVPAVGGIIAFGPWIFPRLLSADYAAVPGVAAVLAVGYGISAIASWTRPALVAMSHVRELNIMSLALTALSVGGLLLLAPAYGALGGALTLSGFFALAATISFLLFRRGLRQTRPGGE